MSDPLLGTVIDDRYQLLEVVGKGGMGVVYRASDVKLGGRPCAVKLLLGTSMDPEEAARFEREVRIISRLRSPHVVGVLDTGIIWDGRRYIVMELLEGLPLSTLLKRGGPLDPWRAVNVVKGILAALAEAHENGVVHRDLKPANVFITRARTGDELAKVLDFGIAKETNSRGQEDLTAASMLIGTPKYMAPEQFLKQPTDGRTDLYAVGLLFYQMLCGQPPFVADQPVPDSIARMPEEFRVGWLHINQAPAPLALPAGMWPILERLLEKEAAYRYGSAEEVIDALVALGQAGAVPPPMPGGDGPEHGQDVSSTTGFPVLGETLNASPRASGGRGGLLAVAAVVMLGGGGAAAWYLTRSPAGQPAEKAAARVPICVDEIRSEPPGATVLVGADSYGATPARIERPCRDQWLARVQLDGYQSEKVQLRGSAQTLTVTLLRQDRRPPEPQIAAPTPPEPQVAPPPVAPPVVEEKKAERPAPAKPREASPAPQKRPEAKAAAPRPAEKKPAETRPAETRPAERKPAEPKSGGMLHF